MTGIGRREWLLLGALSILWGGSFLFVGIAVKTLPPLTVVAARVALAAAALWLFILAGRRAVPKSGAVWASFLGMGLLNNAIPFSLIAFGQTQIAGGLASILNAMTPIFTVLVANALTADERLTPLRAAGVALGFAGVVVMVGWEALGGIGGATMGQLAILGAALSYGLASVFGRRFRRLGVDPVATAAGQVTASSAILLPLALLIDRPWALPAPDAGTIAAVVALGLLSTALAYVLFFRVLAAAGATAISLVTFLIPPSAIVLGWLVLGERLAPQHFAGLGLILAGLAAIDGRLARLAAGRRAA
ncbi:DMT family transporter [Limibaculum sp. M0105]|uniref:DMT family transporter n=1 Tax=Thermohalobaculum xanthum TaxID=2753746 RepID=A0A8J7M9S1_9RHOB|nr:DMT family transporter [Thermohalobaculum xanthum]MBK0400855.1 DMT family transporter [Thermohalobaculum xanthum]